jgi:hypothetical protein
LSIVAPIVDARSRKAAEIWTIYSSAKGGRNHISNRVSSCKPCNAEEKREKDWEQFLLEKHGPGELFEEKRSKILEWVQKAGAVQPLQESTLSLLEEQCILVTSQYEKACRRVRRV